MIGWLLAALLGLAQAADWLTLQGTEVGAEPATLRPWGFVQGLGEGIVLGGPVEGLQSEALAPFNGQVPSYNRVGSGEASWGLSVRRARVGLRGVVPGTQDRVNFLVAAELGDNALTRLDPVVLTDASVTLSLVPGLRLRVGQFKLPLGEEALEMNPIAAEFINFTQATQQLLQENPSASGAYTAGGSGFRDVAAQAFYTFPLGQGELAYALALSNGRMGSLDVDTPKDLTGRLYWAPVVWGPRASPLRDEVALYAWWQQGQRTVDGVARPRVRRGAGAQLRREGLMARVEVVQAQGALETGASPPFPGQPVTVVPEGHALGGHAFVHAERGPLGLGLRYDALWRDTTTPSALRVFHTVTADAQLELGPRARVMLDWEHRWLLAPEGSADAQTLGAALGDRVSAQVVVVF